MGIKLMEFGIHIREGVIFTIRGCCRSVLRHPFLVSIMCAFIYMSRSHPCTFSLLLSASPVVVGTVALLGMLLLSGQQNIPETEKEKRERYKVIALKNGMLCADNLDDQNERWCVERYSKSKRDEVEKVGEDSDLLAHKLAKVRVGGSVDGDVASSKERRLICNDSEGSEMGEAIGELDEAIQQQKGEMVDHYAIISKVIGELLESESEHDKSEEEDCSDSDREENVDSDGAESSSPDASVDETMPMLDELHPLLDEHTPHPVPISGVASEAVLTEQSSISSSIESGEETEIPASDVADDDDEEKIDQTKSVITWTEEDQKNLMDVGSSEIERNQRLERILRRRKNMSMVPEINLIDFDQNSDFHLNIAPISTARINPFDLPHDAYENNAPGSAPSILQPRRNPFDLPYDEDQDETLDASHEEIRPQSQSRQPFLRRRENFLARPSIFSPKGQERQPARFKPLFITEESFQGQSSGVNSGHETESVSSVEALSVAVSNRDPDYDTSPGKNYSSSSSFSDAHTKLDHGLSSSPHGSDTDEQMQGDEIPSSSHRHSDNDEGQVPNDSVESSDKAPSTQNLTIPEFHELNHDSVLCTDAPNHPEEER